MLSLRVEQQPEVQRQRLAGRAFGEVRDCLRLAVLEDLEVARRSRPRTSRPSLRRDDHGQPHEVHRRRETAAGRAARGDQRTPRPAGPRRESRTILQGRRRVIRIRVV